MKSIMDIMRDNNAIGLGTVGIKLDDLGPQVKHLGINIGKDAEIDIMTTFCNGKTFAHLQSVLIVNAGWQIERLEPVWCVLCVVVVVWRKGERSTYTC